ncbi:MAG: NTP transferase domain-containing protein, partial [Candidatus Heimdallarchaeota archaeon]|nr:NTP transferase domain-containing protein [Candidatus Heimdallarchaeota archaeon]
MNIDYRNFPVIILAAGDSKRMGEPKGLLNYRGKPFL